MTSMRHVTAAALAAATPESRDRTMDFLRALSIAVVVFGHWLMAIVTYTGGTFAGTNALEEVPGAWSATWIFQVMPVFFFVGGFANSVSLASVRRRGGTYAEYLRGRLTRLVRPTAVFVAAWLLAAIGLELLGAVDDPALAFGFEVIAAPLWFLSVYVMVVAVAPAMLTLHRRAPIATPLGLAAGAGAVDAVRLGAGWEWFGYLNFVFVWLFAHQLGFHHADGSLARAGRRAHAAMAVAGLGTVAILTNIGVYAPSLVGSASSTLASNNTPPSVVLVAHSVWLIGLAMLCRPWIARLLRRRRAWKAVVAANGIIMTVFLWHLTAMVLAALVALPRGFPQLEPGTAAWWAVRPLWLAMLTVALVPFVVALARFERPDRAGARVPFRGWARTIAGVSAFVLALAGFATGGFRGVLQPVAGVALTPLRSAALFALAAVLLGIVPRRSER